MNAERTVHVGRHRLRVSIRGEGRPVLLINGLGASIAMWAALQEDLAGLQVISFDAPGTGRSSTPTAPYRMSTLADMTAELLDVLGHDQVDVVGYSFGGVLAQQFAKEHPQRVRRLVLCATTPGWGGLAGDVASLLAVMTPVRYYSKRVYTLTAPALAGGAAEADPAFLARTSAARLQDPPSAAGYWLQLMAAWSWSSLPWLHQVPHPALVITGTEDRLIPAVNSDLMASRLPCARVLRIEGWGHYVMLDRTSGAGAAIADFLLADRLQDSRTWRTGRQVGHPEAAAAAAAHRNMLTRLYWQHKAYRWWHTRPRAAARRAARR